MDAAPFIVYAMPRSRSYWLSRFLSYGKWRSGHDELIHMRSFDDVRSWFKQPMTGSVETGAASWWRLIHKFRPDLKTVVLRRPVGEAVDSFARLNVGIDLKVVDKVLRGIDRKLDQIEERVPNVISVTFDGLSREDDCAKVFEHCLPYAHDSAYWARMAPLNLQIDMVALLRYCGAHKPQMETFAKIAKARSLVALQKPVKPVDGMTLQFEDFEAWLADGVHLFEGHSHAVGEPPDSYLTKNVPLARCLAAKGALKIMTARSNGRMFGYLVSVVGPALDAEGVMTATHFSMFASPDAPLGLSLRLFRASNAALKAEGVTEIVMKAGVRGSGPDLGRLYKGLGAEPAGSLYVMKLED